MSFTKKKCFQLFQDFKSKLIAEIESGKDSTALKEFIQSYEEFPKNDEPDKICIGHRSNGLSCNRLKLPNQSFCCIHLKKCKPIEQVVEEDIQEEKVVEEDVQEEKEVVEALKKEEPLEPLKKGRKKGKKDVLKEAQPDDSSLTSEVWMQNINGILYYVDKDNNLFSVEEFKKQTTSQVKSLKKLGNVSVDETGISHIHLF
jgi:hypothetical protein